MGDTMLTHSYQQTTKIFLVRHGQSEWNGQNRVSGQLDPVLTPKGIQQAHALARVLRDEPLAAIYTSSLTRAVETARPTAELHRLPIQTRDALKEINLGVLEGRFRDERDPEAQQLWEEREEDRLHYQVPGGESYLDLERRVTACLNEIMDQEAGKTVLIVGSPQHQPGAPGRFNELAPRGCR
jgi:broad specificity phosphatase PhoE